MPPALKTIPWRPWLLAGGLLVILLTGITRLPEVKIRLAPQEFWQSQVTVARSFWLYAERRKAESAAAVNALKRGQEKGLPSFPGLPAPAPRALEGTLARALAEFHHYSWQSEFTQRRLRWAEEMSRTAAGAALP